MAKATGTQATSLLKAIQVLQALEESQAGRGVTEIARQLGLPKSAVHRLLATFQAQGFVRQLSNRRYILGPTLVRLGLRAAERLTPRRLARPYLEALAQETGETVFLGILAQAEVLIVDKVESTEVLRISPPLGAVVPLWPTALGKLLLAYSPDGRREQLLESLQLPATTLPRERVLRGVRQELVRINRRGFAVSVEEWTPDICCLAVPIRQGQGTVTAALALAMPRSRMPQAPRHDPFGSGVSEAPYPVLPALRTAAERISTVLP
jgi:DNA-binding IclR family transcriptional regulator